MKIKVTATVLSSVFGCMLLMPVEARSDVPTTFPEMEWASGVSGTHWNSGLGVAVDSAGYTAVTGYFWETAVFGFGQSNETVLTASGEHDAFVARYRPDGTLDWVQRAGGLQRDRGKGVAVDSDGNIYVVGECSGNVTFGNGSDVVVLTCEGQMDIFVARYLADGTLDWVKRAGGRDPNYASIGLARGWAIAIDSHGGTVVTGAFGNTMTLGFGEDNQVTLPATTSVNIFIARFHQDGKLDWATSARGQGYIAGWGIAVDKNDTIYVSGYCERGPWKLGNDTKEVTVTCGTYKDIFVARFSLDGELDWLNLADGIGYDSAWAIAVGGDGHAVATGSFQEVMNFGSGDQQTSVFAQGDRDLFVARYRPDGELAWVVQAGGIGEVTGESVAADSSGYVVVTGNMSGSAIFGSGENAVLLHGSEPMSGFIARYAPDGNLDWAVPLGRGSLRGYGIALDGDTHAMVVGSGSHAFLLDPGAGGVILPEFPFFIQSFVARFQIASQPGKALEVQIDVLPGSTKNPIRLNYVMARGSQAAGGVLPVAILSSASFDAKQVNPLTLAIGDPELEGRAYRLEMSSGFEDVNNDGRPDLVVHFSRRELLFQGAINGKTAVLELTGETFDGTSFYGRDFVKILN